MRIKHGKESIQITFVLCVGQSKDTMVVNSDEPRNINKRGADLFFRMLCVYHVEFLCELLHLNF